jgi:hypothetical protein
MQIDGFQYQVIVVDDEYGFLRFHGFPPEAVRRCSAYAQSDTNRG